MFELEDLWYRGMQKAKFNNGKIWLQIVKRYNTHSEEYIQKLEKKFRKISKTDLNEEYAEKIEFWIKNKLTPFKIQYNFSIMNDNQLLVKPVISIDPYTHNDFIKIYLTYLIDWCYTEYLQNKIEYKFETIPFEQLKSRFQSLKGNKEKIINDEIKTTKDRIKNTGVSTNVYQYIIYKGKEPNIISDLKIVNNDSIIALQHFAIETSFVLDFLKYLIFLNQQKSVENKIIANYIPPADKSFKTQYSDEKLQVIHSLLMENKIISQIDFEKFKNIFSEININSIKKEDKIVWLPIKTKGMNWESLILLIKNLCDFNFEDDFNNRSIINKIGRCFTAEDKNRFNNYSNGISRTIRKLKENSFKLKSKNLYFETVEDILSQIP